MPSTPHPDRYSERAVKAGGFGAQMWEREQFRPADFQRQPYVDYLRDGGKPDAPRGQMGTADSAAIDHVLREGAGRVTRINDTTRAQLRDIIRQGVRDGLSPAELGDRIQASTAFSEYRAERIARTELMFAYNSAALGSYSKHGITHVQAIDGDKDEECINRNGRTYPVTEAYSIEDHPNGTLDWVPVVNDLIAGATEPKPEREPDREPAPKPERARPQPPQVPAPKPVDTRTPIQRLSSDDAVSQVRSGKVTLEQALKERHGLQQVIKEPGYRATLQHDAQVVRAFETAAETGSKLNVHTFRYAGDNKPGAAAEYFYPGQRVPAGTRGARTGYNSAGYETTEMTVTEVRMYQTTERYLGRRNYPEYVPGNVDDFTATVQHELGHAAEFTRGLQQHVMPYQSEAFRTYETIWEAGKDGVNLMEGRITRELAEVRKMAKQSREMIAEATERAAAGDARYQGRIDLHNELLTAYQRQEAELLRRRAIVKDMRATGSEAPLTQYGKTNAREDFAESYWFYINRPDILRERAPARFKFMRELFS